VSVKEALRDTIARTVWSDVGGFQCLIGEQQADAILALPQIAGLIAVADAAKLWDRERIPNTSASTLRAANALTAAVADLEPV
jgi:hypothetical protein